MDILTSQRKAMKLTLKNSVRGLNKHQYQSILHLTHNCKNLYNYGLYHVRQAFFNDNHYIKYSDLYEQVKSGRDYKSLPSQVAQQVLRLIDKNFKSFFALLLLRKKGAYKEKVRLPRYLPKQGHYIAIFPQDMFRIDKKDKKLRLSLGKFFQSSYDIRFLYFDIPPYLLSSKIKIQQIRLIAKYRGRHIEIEYVYEIEQSFDREQLDRNQYLGIDLGLDNFIAGASTIGTSFILEGKGIKSFNQWWNKIKALLQSVYDKQKHKHLGYQLSLLLIKRKHVIHNFISQNINYILKYCLEYKIGQVVVGDWEDMKRNNKMEEETSQLFQIFPFKYFKNNLKVKLALHGIEYIETEESFTSQTCSNCGLRIKSNRIFRGL